MTRHESYDTHVYVEGRDRPLPVGMYTDEHSQVCSIRFSNSFTLNVVDPQELLALAREIETFAMRAHEPHYGIQAQRVEAPGEEVAQLQQKLEDCGVEGCSWCGAANYDNPAAADVYVPPSPRQSKVERLMRGTVSAPQIDPMNDPMNW